MGMNYIDAGMLKNAFLAGAKGLEANKEWINELNVSPSGTGNTFSSLIHSLLASRPFAPARNAFFNIPA